VGQFLISSSDPCSIRYLRMGNTGIKVSQLCLGTWHLPLLAERDPSGVQRVDIGETLRIMRRAYDLGINFVDTANRYHGAMQRAGHDTCWEL